MLPKSRLFEFSFLSEEEDLLWIRQNKRKKVKCKCKNNWKTGSRRHIFVITTLKRRNWDKPQKCQPKNFIVELIFSLLGAEWVSDSPSQWVSDGPSQWVSDSPSQWVSDSPSQRVSDSPSQWVSDSHNECLTVRHKDCLTGRHNECLTGRHNGCLTGRHNACLTVRHNACLRVRHNACLTTSQCVSDGPSQINYFRFIREEIKYLLPNTVDFTKYPILSLFFVCADLYLKK